MANTKKILVGIMLCSVAILATGCSDSNPVNLDTAIDTAPPAAPFAVRSSMDNSTGGVVISWGVNTVDSDLAGYIVTRANEGQVTPLVSTPVMAQSVVDANPAWGINHYSVYAVDLAGNQSAVRNISYTLVGIRPEFRLSR